MKAHHNKHITDRVLINLFSSSVVLFILAVSFQLKGQPPGYSYMKVITIDETKVPGSSNLTNFSMLFSVTDTDLKTVTNGGDVQNANGWDIVFTDASCGILSHQIESYNAATGNYVAWVKIPTLSAIANTKIAMYYGNSSVSTDPSATATWDSNFMGVWHLSNNNFNDFTSNGNNGTNTSTTNTTGAIAAARQNAVSQYVQVPHSSTLVFPAGTFSLEGWFYSSGSQWSHMPSKSGCYTIRLNGTEIIFNVSGTGDFSGGTMPDNAWTHIACVYIKGGPNTIQIYVNGNVVLNTTAWGSAGTASNPLYFGSYLGTGSYLSGRYDEIRISNIARSGDWITTEYNNQNSPSTFYSVGAESSGTGCPLPIELLYFNGHNNGNVNILQWATASETNNDFFTLERTKDGLNYEEFSVVDGAGNSNTILTYETTDPDPYLGTNYYRLKQTDFNGLFSYSQVISINLSGINLIGIYPNVSSGSFNYFIGSDSDYTVDVEVISTTGQKIYIENRTLSAGLSELSIDVSYLSSGTYVLRVITSDKKHQTQLQFVIR